MLNIAFQSRCQWGHLLLQLSNWRQCLGSSVRWLLQEHGYWRKAEKEYYGNLIKERKQEKRQERWWKKEQDIRSTSKAEGKYCTKKIKQCNTWMCTLESQFLISWFLKLPKKFLLLLFLLCPLDIFKVCYLTSVSHSFLSQWDTSLVFTELHSTCTHV